MTRAWVWGARGEIARALQFNAAGALLLWGLWGNALIRAALRFGLPAPRWLWIAGLATVLLWFVIWMGGWALRLHGWYPLEGDGV